MPGFIESGESIHILSELGLAFFLLLLSLVEVMAVFSISFLSLLLAGIFSLEESMYAAFCLAFSNTLVAVKPT
jgi:hypothetical protein